MEALKAQDPAHIGAYTLLARLGAGGMGQVYLGRSPGGRLVALKVIRDEIVDRPEALARFRREVETVRAVRSAYTANLIDASLEAAPYWLATEYVAGPTLSLSVEGRGPLPAETCRGVLAALAEGLAAVHAQGVTHRDLKPQNVILAGQGPQLIDFGIARGVGQTALTEAGYAPGTPGYIAPETLVRNDAGPAADVFALGATLAYAATGRPPFGTGDPSGVHYRAVHEPIDVGGVEPELAALINQCVAKDPAERPTPGQVVERCGVRSALVEDTHYASLLTLAEAVPRGPGPGAAGATPLGQAAPLGVHDLPTRAPGPAHPGYTPTQVVTGTAARRRGRSWLIAVATGLAIGVGTAAVMLALPDGKEGGSAKGGQEETGAARPAATSSTPTDPAGGGGEADAPMYVESQRLVRDMWLGDTQQCNLPAEERNEYLQYGIVPADGGESYSSGPVKISVRLKYADPEPGERYYLSVAMKPPYFVDPETGEALHNAAQGNVSLGFTSRPIDMYEVYKKPDSNGTITLTYPDDFDEYVQGKKYQDAVPVATTPGDWTVLFLHVRENSEFASIACDGFKAE
ncbi:serine/threonine-protein kinase [Streptomyces lancefieldiae]|uniref:Protein kinase n=1 Tax=Streptomyces lancefieldiae TaxID=3075520 RepID=A0ABU3AVL9_9ACTN|nr:protein kinase [Streptomyces sp. DSM 40712]MDT0613865.1 protein kinase [Streptomyces sp. DSM 40712]